MFLTVALITATVPVQAAEFGTPDSFEEIFSSGEEDSCITDTENTLPAASDSEKVMASELSPTPTVTSTPEGTPALTETPTPSVTPMPSSTPTPSVTPSPSPTPTINPEKEVMLRFIDGEGNECEQLRTVMSWGESLILPNVPDTGAPDMWKLEKNEKLGDAITLKGGDILTLKKGENWNLFLEKGILNFYMPKKCTVSLYNNSGTSVFSNGILHAYETKNVILPDMPSSKYINYGWTDKIGRASCRERV